ncbi:sigma-70 family RNA polymerase sigma factor [Kitasatospora sp. NPDC049285]|uniref:sigma-70 family RNA polymerase sigma factor n=1 Tax=Kitasatospora sp. NPDC049285 TaxID=3157096 RepID=UPI0034446FEA
MHRVSGGDRGAYESLHEQLAGTVYGVSLRVLRNPSHAEEVAQETLLEVWRSALSYRPERGSVTTWVCTIAHRRAVDRVRSARASSDREERAVRQVRTIVEPAEDEVERSMEAASMRRALAGLSEVQREALVLAYYGGYTQTQVAALPGVPLGTVKTRKRDGLRRLRAVFDGA